MQAAGFSTIMSLSTKEARMEHWESLKSGGYRFVYDDALFRPGTDTFVLSSFPRLKPGLRVWDLGCGTGLLGLLLLQRQQALQITGLELQAPAAELAQRAAIQNGLDGRFHILQGDLRKIRSLSPSGGADLVLCNPPYYSPLCGKLPAGEALRAARAETHCTLEDVCTAAAYLLRWGGSFCLVHKPERLADLLEALRAAALEPKRLRFVCSGAEDAPSLVLAEGRRGGRPGLAVEPPLILRTAAGTPTAELDAIYFRQQEEHP